MSRGKPHWLSRAVNQDGYVLDEILQPRRNTKAARNLLTRLLKRQGVRLSRMITDKLKSYGAARRKLGASIGHLSHKGLNDRAENSHLPLRKRARIMQKFRSPGGSQRFVSVFSAIRDLFVPSASITIAFSLHIRRIRAFAQWGSAIALSA
ncbi:transposase [Asaia bogorensis NBRC 16594]|nr:transposase [Asaia bogorensis NBRC 16594]